MFRARITREHEAQNAAKAAAAQRKASMQNFIARPIKQQQAALNLARLANKEKDIGLSEGNIDALILSLTVRFLLLPHLQCFRSSALIHVKQAEAPNDVIAALSNATLPPVIANERAQLLKLQELIQRRLNG